MARGAIPPTRSNYLRTQRRLERARHGYDMLERKRQILVMELMHKLEAARVAQEVVREAMAQAYAALENAALSAGIERLVRESCGMPTDHNLQTSVHSVMGVAVPEISFECAAGHTLQFALTAGASGADEVLGRFHDALEPIVRLAEVENAVLRLAREIKRTQRRVNALEKTFIPDYEDTLTFIGECLDEREREELVIIKKIKRRRESARYAAEGRNG
jgi:V/A-type H+-transporting ATPase subunit D